MTMVRAEIEISHRIKLTLDSTIVVKFVSRRIRNNFLYERKQLKGKTFGDFGFNSATKVYIHESLTAANGELLHLDKKWDYL